MLRPVDALTHGHLTHELPVRPNQAVTRCAVRLSMLEAIVVGGGDGQQTTSPGADSQALRLFVRAHNLPLNNLNLTSRDKRLGSFPVSDSFARVARCQIRIQCRVDISLALFVCAGENKPMQ